MRATCLMFLPWLFLQCELFWVSTTVLSISFADLLCCFLANRGLKSFKVTAAVMQKAIYFCK